MSLERRAIENYLTDAAIKKVKGTEYSGTLSLFTRQRCEEWLGEGGQLADRC